MSYMSKKKNSILTFVTSIMLTMLRGILGLIVTRLILKVYGSDFNGINATANQFVNVLLLVEGGFTLSTNVALFKPLVTNNKEEVNQILSATSKIFHRVGFLFLTIGIIGSYFYVMLIKTEIERIQVFLLFLFTIIPSAYNLFFSSKYAVLLRAEQKEYLIHLVNIAITICTQLALIYIATIELHYFAIRLVQMVGLIISNTTIVYICKKQHPELDLSTEPKYTAIKGTKDVLVQKITSLIYGTAPVLYISMFLGSLYVSVYAVYNSIYSLIKQLLYALVNAPRMSFGALIAERDNYYVQERFLLYEFIVILSSAIIFTSVYVMTMPFIKLYTTGITDAQYIDSRIPLFLVLIGYFEIIHIPSGHILNMSGNFNQSKIFQLIAALLLIITIPVFSYFFGFIGILGGLFVAAIGLAILEISFVHIRYFHNLLLSVVRLLLINTITGIVLSGIEINHLSNIDNYFQFLLLGFFVLGINTIIFFLVNFLFNKKYTDEFIQFIGKKVIRMT